MQVTTSVEEAAAPSLRAGWQALADGLWIQRVQLHVGEWREVLHTSRELPDVAGASTAGMARRPGTPRLAQETNGVLERAGMSYWCALPQQFGTETVSMDTPTDRGAAAARRRLLSAGGGATWMDGVAAVCEAAAWWVGFFAIIRHRGVRHRDLEPAPDPLHAAVLEAAAYAVAIGAADRYLASVVRTVEDELARDAYCEAVTAGIEVERGLPALLDELGELRLVDLVSTTAVWRGQFTKYTGGTGAGQVE